MRSVMRANPRRDTRPERHLRSLLHAMGLRYRVDAAPLARIRRRADLLFPRARIAVFVDGCFWHGCPQHYRPARTNAEFWDAKLVENRTRDRETDQMLSDGGWRVIRVWEHEDMAEAAAHIRRELRARVR
nr:very short patch repair endonuclease [Mycobacterium sp. 1081908.1]